MKKIMEVISFASFIFLNILVSRIDTKPPWTYSVKPIWGDGLSEQTEPP